MIQDPIALLGFMFLIVAFARWLESQVAFIKKISSAVVCTLLGILLGNAGVVPQSGPIHTAIADFAVPYSIVLVILASHLGDLKVAGVRLVTCYALAGIGTFAGSFVASLVFAQWLGPETWKLGGMFAAAFMGGGMNFVAVGRELETSPGLFSAALVADNLSTVPYLLAQIGLAAVLARYFTGTPAWRMGRSAAPVALAGGASVAVDLRPAHAVDPSAKAAHKDPRRYWTDAEISITDMAFLAAAPLAAIWLAGRLEPLLPGFPQVLWLTTIAVIAAQLPITRRLRGASVMSYFSLHLFFISIGAASGFADVIEAGPMLFVYMTVILAVHVFVTYGLGWLLGFDIRNISMASQAAIGGPGSALALGMAMQWSKLVTPGIIIGILGYSVGNYLGFLCSYLLRWLL